MPVKGFERDNDLPGKFSRGGLLGLTGRNLKSGIGNDRFAYYIHRFVFETQAAVAQTSRLAFGRISAWRVSVIAVTNSAYDIPARAKRSAVFRPYAWGNAGAEGLVAVASGLLHAKSRLFALGQNTRRLRQHPNIERP